MATTFSLVVIFVPVSFMSSVSGRFLYQFGITATVSILVKTPNGMNFQNEDTIAEIGAGVLQPGNTSSTFTLVNTAANRDFVFEGTGFAWTGNVLTAGTIFAIHELTHDTQLPLVDFTGHIDAPSFYSAAVAQAAGDKTLFDALYGFWKTNSGGGPGLMTWCLQGGTNSCQAQGGGSATDADEDAAFALIQAAKVFGTASYMTDAATIIGQIWSKDIDTWISSLK